MILKASQRGGANLIFTQLEERRVLQTAIRKVRQDCAELFITIRSERGRFNKVAHSGQVKPKRRHPRRDRRNLPTPEM